MKKISLLTLCGMALACAGGAVGQTTVATLPVGFVNVTVPAQSDAMISVPMLRSAVFQGTISSISGGNQVTLSGTPTIPAGTTCALMLSSGAKEGLTARITAQAGAVVTVSLDAGDDFSGVVTGASGDKVRIVPYWTPATLIPSTAPVGTQILGLASSTVGVNLAPDLIYVHSGGGVWRNGVSRATVTDLALPFNAAFVVRNNAASPLTFALVGEVPVKKHRSKLATLANNTAQDNRVGFSSPVPETLDNVGPDGTAEGDQILGFDNTATGYNKQPSESLVMNGGVWKDGLGNSVGATFQFKPGFGYIFRKAATGSATQTVWTAVPAYLPLQP